MIDLIPKDTAGIIIALQDRRSAANASRVCKGWHRIFSPRLTFERLFCVMHSNSQIRKHPAAASMDLELRSFSFISRDRCAARWLEVVDAVQQAGMYVLDQDLEKYRCKDIKLANDLRNSILFLPAPITGWHLSLVKVYLRNDAWQEALKLCESMKDFISDGAEAAYLILDYFIRNGRDDLAYEYRKKLGHYNEEEIERGLVKLLLERQEFVKAFTSLTWLVWDETPLVEELVFKVFQEPIADEHWKEIYHVLRRLPYQFFENHRNAAARIIDFLLAKGKRKRALRFAYATAHADHLLPKIIQAYRAAGKERRALRLEKKLTK